MDAEDTKCPICGENIDNSHCQECWGNVLSKLSEFRSIMYHIENCVNDDDDIKNLEAIIELADDLTDEAADLSRTFKEASKK